MNKAQENIVLYVQIRIGDKQGVTEDEISDYIEIFSKVDPISDEEKEEVKKELHSRLLIKMDVGNCLKETKHSSWYFNSKKENDQRYWKRYNEFLFIKYGFNKNVINAMDVATDEMMDLLGNPKSPYNFNRRGLVIGDVQSGKTSTYTALINKAADSGYKVIILLTGTIEKLRQQTQGRLDEGFTGLDSKALIRNKTEVKFGVGEIDGDLSGWSLTSTNSDFNTNAANQFTGKIRDLTVPALFVLKKNKKILEKVEHWLRRNNADNGIISEPMLLIDDEADNASVNTRKDDEEPTAINACIRKLLKLFVKANYIAFTATPYANIFINPDSKEEMINEDLFPKHFIYALEPPTNYIGARDVFGDEGNYSFMKKNNDDCECYLPEKHKKDFIPEELPLSLKEAVCSFFISNAIRDMRKSYNSHRTMLINISRFINVQNNIRDQVDAYVREVRREIHNYANLGKEALQYPNISFVKIVYDKHYKNLYKKLPIEELKGEKMFCWEEVQSSLYSAIAPIVVRTVNGSNSKKSLNYDECEKNGLRLIAVGGFSLSRGLTLEGLTISYFYRNSKMYDTLMQMGRWFGYRNHYADLCQIWMSETSEEWYRYISTVSDELKQSINRMTNLRLTPEDFGLGVRADINSLLVTAVNKMRYTKDIPMVLCLNGTVVETPYLPIDAKNNMDNFKTVKNWISNLIENGYKVADNKELNLSLNHPQFLNIPKSYIIDFLQSYIVHVYNFQFRTNDVLESIKNDKDNVLNNWDVVIATGSCEKTFDIGGLLQINPIMRSFAINKEKNALQISGSKSRIGAVNFAKGGLTKEKAASIKNKAIDNRTSNKDKSLNQDEYFNTGENRNPLLIIYPVMLSAKSMDRETGLQNIDETKQQLIDDYKGLWTGLAVGIPSINGKEMIKYNYTINIVKWKELLGIDDTDFYEETGEEGDGLE